METETCKKLHLALNRAWWYGIMFSTGFHMLVQDWMGLEGYIEFVQENWTDMHWIVGLLIATAGLFLWTGLLGRYEWLKKEKQGGK